jgi:hypothetical protein
VTRLRIFLGARANAYLEEGQTIAYQKRFRIGKKQQKGGQKKTYSNPVMEARISERAMRM